MLCEVCHTNEISNYCTANICEECCKSAKCPIRQKCALYRTYMELKK